MKIGFCTIAFRDEPVADVIRRAAAIGFDEVELIGRQVAEMTDEQLDATCAAAADAGIAISGVSPYFWLTQTPELLDESMAIAERFIHIARRTQARMIRTFTDAGPTGISSAKATEAHWETAVTALRKITAMAPDLVFAVETHAKTLADTPETCLRLMREVGAPNLKWLYQPFEARNPVDDFLLLEPDVRQVHLNPHIDSDGSDIRACGTDYEALLRTMAERGYLHSVALELCKPGEATWAMVEDHYRWIRETVDSAIATTTT